MHNRQTLSVSKGLRHDPSILSASLSGLKKFQGELRQRRHGAVYMHGGWLRLSIKITVYL